MSKRDYQMRLFINKIIIENWKSIRKLELELTPGINILAGANATGKTNILEAINFLYKSLVEAAGRTPYISHLPEYWSGRDLIHMKDPSQPVKIGFNLEIYMKTDNDDLWEKSEVQFIVTYQYDPANDTLHPTMYSIVINRDTTLNLYKNKIEVIVTGNLAKYVVKNINSLNKDGDNDNNYIVKFNILDPNTVYAKIQLEDPIDLVHKVTPFLFLYNIIDNINNITYGEIIITKDKAVQLPFWNKLEETRTPRGRQYKSYNSFTIILERKKEKEEYLFLFNLISDIKDILSHIIFLRHPDIGTLGEPRRFEGRLRLDPRARNLAEVIIALRGKRGRLEILEEAIRRAFPGYTLKVEASHGRVYLIAEERGLELPPPNMPDGLVKLAALAVALELEPIILLVDELENSMHAALLEQVFDMLDSQPVPVLVATHSPVLIDLAGPEKVILVRRDDEGTVAERIRDPERLRRALEEEGIALSDHVLQTLTRQQD